MNVHLAAIALAVSAIALGVVAAPAAGNRWDEAWQGDLSGDGQNPTDLGVWSFLEIVRGTTGRGPGGDVDADIFTFTVGFPMVGFQIADISPGQDSLFAIAAGDTISKTDFGTHLSNILIDGPGHYFDDLAHPVFGGPGIHGRLGYGTYTVWFEAADEVRDYTMFFYLPDPEPTTGSIVGLALLTFSAMRPRRA